jgi:hypothetical protein
MHKLETSTYSMHLYPRCAPRRKCNYSSQRGFEITSAVTMNDAVQSGRTFLTILKCLVVVLLNYSFTGKVTFSRNVGELLDYTASHLGK